ncbi:MAG: sulfatase [Myxococcota bacterium]
MMLLAACAPDPRPETVVLVVLDTVRADRLGAYGGPATPAFDAIAARGTLYERAWAAAPWTLPSHGTLFTGLPPEGHGCTSATLACDPRADMLAERFAAAGWATGGFSNNPWVSPDTGLADGFDVFVEVFREAYGVRHAIARYVDPDMTGLSDAGAARTVGAVDRWLAGVGDRPAFVFVNLVEAHFPYDPPAGWREDRPGGVAGDRRLMDRWLATAYAGRLGEPDAARARALYDEEIAYTDAQLGELFRVLERHGRADDALVVVTADHGEGFGEHRADPVQLIDHQLSVHDELLHVPLVVRWPGVAEAGARVGEDVGLVDVAPLLAWALDGRAGEPPALLRPPPGRAFTASYVPPANEIPILAEHVPGGGAALASRALRAVRLGREKLIAPSDGPPALFDLVDDPGETRDLAAARPDRVRVLEALLPPLPEPPGATPAAGSVEALRALGYVQ